MKFLGLTQKVETSKFGNFCDVIDQKWYKFLSSLDIVPVLIPNDICIMKKVLKDFDLEGFILSGGNDLAQFGGNVSQRDEVEKYLIQWSIDKNTPLLGVCRGMQLILDFFSVKMCKIEGHVNQKHSISFFGNKVIVNSFHNYGCNAVSENITVLASSEDGVVEAIKHREHKIYGMMWHPERNDIISEVDKSFFKEVFQL